MRSETESKEAFVGGLVLGLAAGGVAIVTIEAARRGVSCPGCGRRRYIDGVHPPSRVELAARPPAECSSSAAHGLESEALDVPHASQRW